jgi:hypothetical protein
MKRTACAFFTIFYAALSSADVCVYSAPDVIAVGYQKGIYLPLYFSGYQLDLPEIPVAFLNGDGFTAIYPDKGYIGLQQINSLAMADSLARMAPELKSISEFYRLIYGDFRGGTSLKADPQELRIQRKLLKLDCHSHVAFFQLADAQVIFHEARTESDFHMIFVLAGEEVALITVRGSTERAVQIIRSIKRRL